MNDEYMLRAFWGNRKESLNESAGRIACFFERISPLDEAFRRWMRPLASRKGASAPFSPSASALAPILERNRKRNRGARWVVDSMPWDIVISNGLSWPDAIRVQLTIGGTCASPGIPNPNSCLIYLPTSGDAAVRLLSAESLRSLMHAVASVFDVEWGCVTMTTLLEMMTAKDRDRDMVGWVTYFSNRYGQLPLLGERYRVEQLGDIGKCIIVATNGRFTTSNSNHCNVAVELADFLDDAGVLSRTVKKVR